MAFRLASLFFAILAIALFSTMAFGLLGPFPGTDPQTIFGGYGDAAVSDFIRALDIDQRHAWRAMLIYVDLPFILCTAIAAYLALHPAYGMVRRAGLLCLWIFVFTDVLEDLQLLTRLEPYLDLEAVAVVSGGNAGTWLGWVTSVKLASFALMLLGVIAAIWQKPEP